MKKAIVTINLGERHQKLWSNICKPNWEMYAKRFGYDIINFEEPLDQSERAAKRSPSWQKCLILSQPSVQQYEQVLWLDSDILINLETAPDAFSFVPVDKIGGIEDWSDPSVELYKKAMQTSQRIQPGILNELSVKEYYTNFGLPDTFAKVMQGGVFIASPAYHREVMEKVYYGYEDKGAAYWHYEMRPLSYEIQKAGFIVWMPGAFNYLWGVRKLLEYPDLVEKTGKGGSLLFKVVRRLAYETGIDLYPSYTKKIKQHFKKAYFFHFAGTYADILFMRGENKHV
jgi:hypothetical protein